MPASARSWLLAAAVASVLSGAIPCHTPASLVDADAELHMHGRQARGVVTVLGSIAGCRFQVSRLELAPGGELEWLGSDQTNVALVNGQTPKVSLDRVPAGGYNNSGAVDTFRLTGDWSRISMLVLWDINLERPVASAVLQKLRPGPEQVRALSPTMLDNCYALTPDLRVRWSLIGGGGAGQAFIDIGLEGKFPSGGYMSFGPAEPTSTSRQMVGSDVVVAGYHGSNAFAVDSYISAVRECTSYTGGQANGVCDDHAFTGLASSLNSELLYAHEIDGVTFVKYRRPLAKTDPHHDHPIMPGTNQPFIFAVGGTEAGDPDACAYIGPRVRSHGQNQNRQFGELHLDMGALTHSCPIGNDTSAVGTSQVSTGMNFRAELDGTVFVEWKLEVEHITLRFGGLAGDVAWASLGFIPAGHSGNKMVGSRALVAWRNGDDDNVVNVTEYQMTALTADGMEEVESPDTALDAVLSTGFEDGTISATVRVHRDALGIDSVDPKLQVIWAVGPSWAMPPRLSDVHSDRSGLATTLDLATGKVTKASVSKLIIIHGLLMVAAWLIFMPVAVFAARFRADVHGPYSWMIIHKRFNVLASVVMTGGAAAIVAWKVERDVLIFSATAHGNYGIAALALMAMQVLNGFHRPGKVTADSPTTKKVVRRGWEIGHRVIAMSSFLIAVIACFEGFTAAKRFGVVGTPEMGLGTAIWLVALTSIWFLRELMGSSAKRSASKSATLEAPATELENARYATPARGKGMFANIAEDTIADDGGVQESGGPPDDDDEEGGGYLNIAAATDSGDSDETTTLGQSDMDDSEGEDGPPAPGAAKMGKPKAKRTLDDVKLRKKKADSGSPQSRPASTYSGFDDSSPHPDGTKGTLAGSPGLQSPHKLIQPADASSPVTAVKERPARPRLWFWRSMLVLLVGLVVGLLIWISLIGDQVGDASEASADTSAAASATEATFCVTPNDIMDPDWHPATLAPTLLPTTGPTASPTAVPTASPTAAPSALPTSSPTVLPTTMSPSEVPTTVAPTQLDETFTPTTDPTLAPTLDPTTPGPTTLPTTSPTRSPTGSPTRSPTGSPTVACSAFPADHVGDGWCDDYTPFNTAACGWDGGDCCTAIQGHQNCRDPSHRNYGTHTPKGAIPAPRNPRYTITTRPETTHEVATNYNNYYELSYSKAFDVSSTVEAFFHHPNWAINITGLVDRPQVINVVDLIAEMQLEERYYRHRCVEAWAIAVPWLGFPMSKLLDLVGPQPEARYLKFTTYMNPTLTPNQVRQPGSSFRWPYVEGVTIEEAQNELAFFTVGLYQNPINASNGGPLRVTLPWKYGLKSIKSIKSIEFTTERPVGFWGHAAASEYGFWANVNPEVPHRRWSQATERKIVDDAYTRQRDDTLLFNSYEAEVAYLYENMDEDVEDLWH